MEERWKLTGGRLVAEKRREKKVTRAPCTVSLESPSRQLASSRLSYPSHHSIDNININLQVSCRSHAFIFKYR